MMFKPICKDCKGDTINIEAFARWDNSAQDWVLYSVYEDFYCPLCDGTTVEWVASYPISIPKNEPR